MTLRTALFGFLLGSIGLSFLLYSNTIPGAFVYDDVSFAERTELRDVRHLPKIWAEPLIPSNPDVGAWRPLTTTTYALNFILFGESPASFHVVNIVLNGLNVFLVFLVIFALFRNVPLALFSALFFAFLPIHTAAVASIKVRDELLSTFFTLLAWLAFLRATKKQEADRHVLAGSVALSFLAMLSKEPAIIVPFLFLAVFIALHGWQWRVVHIGLPFLIPIILSLVLRWLVVGENILINRDLTIANNPLIGASFWQGIWTAFAVLATYMLKTFIPLGLSATYGFNHFPLVSSPLESPLTVTGILLASGIVALLLWPRTRRTPFQVGAMMFAITYILISRFLFRGMGGEIIQEHWMYLPSLGIAVIVGTAFAHMYAKNRYASLTVFVLVLALYAAVIIPRNRIWLSEKAFYAAMLRDAPESLQAHLNTAITAFNEGNIPRAKQHLGIAFSIYPDHHRVLNLLGKIALQEGKLEEAADHFLHAMSVRPQHPDAHKLYALTLAYQGKYEESLQKATFHLHDHPRDPQLRFLMAVNLYKLGREDEAGQYLDWNPMLPEEERWRRLREF